MEFLTILWTYILSLAPYLMLGLFVSGVIKYFLTTELITKVLGANSFWGVIKAAFIGVPLPLCSCAVIPTAITFRKSGASNASTSSFIISTPESGIDSIAVTYALMDLPMTILRPVAAFLSAIVAGAFQLSNDFQVTEKEKPSCCSKSKKKLSFIESIRFAYFDLLGDIALWLTFGIFLGACIEYFVPMNMFETLNGHTGRLLILAIGIPFYICASASTPIAASLVLKGMSPGTALLFLLVGPATNASNILVLQKYIGKKGIIINIASIAFVALGMSYLVDYLYTSFGWSVNFKIDAHHNHEEVSWIPLISSLVFIPLLLKGLWSEELYPRLKKASA